MTPKPENNLKISYISNEALADKAEEIHGIYNNSDEYPVPIEDIAEFGLGLGIIPVPNLQRSTGIDAYISHDFKHVVIDEYCYTRVITRARYSIAHEIAHFILHKRLYEEQGINSEAEYTAFTNSLDAAQIKRIESQSYALAGYLLVPNSEFRRLVDEAVSLAGGVEQFSFLELTSLIELLKKHFNVSGEVIQRRFQIEYLDLYSSLFNL